MLILASVDIKEFTDLYSSPNNLEKFDFFNSDSNNDSWFSLMSKLITSPGFGNLIGSALMVSFLIEFLSLLSLFKKFNNLSFRLLPPNKLRLLFPNIFNSLSTPFIDPNLDKESDRDDISIPLL